MKTICTLRMLICSCLCFTTPLQSQIIPFHLLGKLIIVEATVNGQHGYYLLDLGVADLMLNEKYFSGQKKGSEFMGIADHAIGAMYLNSNMEMAKHKWKNIPAQIVSLKFLEDIRGTPIAGLLGWRLFRHHQLTIDIPARAMKIGPTASEPFLLDTTNALCISKYPGNRPSLEVTLGKKRLRLLVDTGSELTVLRKELKRKLTSTLQAKTEKKVLGLCGSKSHVKIFEISDMAIGNHLCKPVQVYFSSLEHFNRQSDVRMFDGVLGHELLRQFKMVIDFSNQYIYLYKNSTDEEATH